MEPTGSIHDTAAAGKGEKKLTCQNPARRCCYFGHWSRRKAIHSCISSLISGWWGCEGLGSAPGLFLCSAGAKEQVCQLAELCWLQPCSLLGEPCLVGSQQSSAPCPGDACVRLFPVWYPTPGVLKGISSLCTALCL